MDVTRLGQHAYIKVAVLQRKIARECHSDLVKVVGNNALPYRTVSSISPLQCSYFDVSMLVLV